MDERQLAERLYSAMKWANESSVARKTNFDASVLDAIVDSVLEHDAFTHGQARAINNVYERWHIARAGKPRARAKREATAEAPASKRPRI